MIGMQERPATIEALPIIRRGLSITGSLGHAGHDTFPHVISLIARGVIDPSRIITHRFSVWNAGDALAFAAQRANSLKITLTQ